MDATQTESHQMPALLVAAAPEEGEMNCWEKGFLVGELAGIGCTLLALMINNFLNLLRNKK